MAYDPYTAVNNIYNLKGSWADADKAGDTNKKNRAAADAQTYYAELRNNGYGDIADALAATDYQGAKAINDKWATTGKTKTRDYFYSLGASRGMSQSDVDKIISWDNLTGEVSLAGKKIGKPDVVIDGTSYWSDTTALDNAWNDYLKRSEPTMDDATLMAKHNNGIYDKVNQLWGLQTDDHAALSDKWSREYEDLKNTNPFTTDEAKAILGKYDLAALQGRDNAVASGSASNGGNIDSYSAANAMRQQASLISQGQQAVLSSYNDKLANARAILEGLGAYQKDSYAGMQDTIGLQQTESQRLFEDEQTAKKNYADITGYVPAEWTLQNDAFLKNFVDENGKLKDEYYNTDFQALINNAKKKGDTELANKYAILRGLKIFGNFSEYGKYLNEGDVAYVSPQRTADYNLSNKQIDSAEKISLAGNETTKYVADTEAKNALDQIDTAAKYTTTSSNMTLEQATSALKNGVLTDAVLSAYNAGVGGSYTMNNPPPVYKAPDSDEFGNESNATDYNKNLDAVYEESSDTVKNYIRDVLKPYLTENTISETELRENLLANSKEYDLEVKDLKAICQALGADTLWVDDYKNSGLFGWGSGVKES